MDALFQDMMDCSGDLGYVRFFEKAYKAGKLSYQEYHHNIVVAILLSQQTLPHATFWPIARFASNPEALDRVRNNPEVLVELVAEEYRVHGPSSPILMPYMTLKDDNYGPLSIPKGTVVQIMPSLMHTNPRLWESCDDYDMFRFSKTIRARLDAEDSTNKAKEESMGAVPLNQMNAMLFSRTDATDSVDRPLKVGKAVRRPSNLREAPKSDSKQRYIPFGLGRGTCPGQKLGLATVLNSVKALIDNWDIEIVDDKGLLQ
jgi:cytochrome P450